MKLYSKKRAASLLQRPSLRNYRSYFVRLDSPLFPPFFAIMACAAANRAIGTRYGEHET